MKCIKTTKKPSNYESILDRDFDFNWDEIVCFLPGYTEYCICPACGQKLARRPGRICLYTHCPVCSSRMLLLKTNGLNKKLTENPSVQPLNDVGFEGPRFIQNNKQQIHYQEVAYV